MKKIGILLVVLLILSVGLAGCGGSQQAQQSSASNQTQEQTAQTEEKNFTIKIAGIKTDDDPASVAMKLFADEVNKNSNGSIKVQVYTNSVLGNLNDLLTGMTNGTVDMLYNTFSCYSWLEGAKRFNVVSAPYLWDSNEELQAFLDSDISKQWMDEAAAVSGVRVVIAKGELPPRELTANKAIKTADDFKGVKIRTAESPIVQETMKKLGAIPVVIPFSDLYMALKQGTVDAQENNFITVMTNSFYEVQKYFMKTDYIRDVSAIFISEKVWEELTENQKKIIVDAADKAVGKEAELVASQNNKAIDFLSTKMTYVEPDIDSIKAKLGSDLYEKFDREGKLWPTGTIDKIMEFKASYSSK